jgi:hypothetical protein
MEMKAALKVLNDSIHRPQRGSSKLLVNAIEIVRREWIQVTFQFLLKWFSHFVNRQTYWSPLHNISIALMNESDKRNCVP